MINLLHAHKIPVGISSCLLGDKVRYDAGHCQSNYCMGPLSQYFEYVKFCPEMAAGFGAPRPTIRLVGDFDNPRLAYTKDPQTDLSEELKQGYRAHLDKLEHLDGYILTRGSPSCGMSSAKVYRENGHSWGKTRAGFFAHDLMQRYPNLPVEEQGRLNDAGLRENFVLRVFAHHHFRHQVLDAPSMAKLQAFHRDYKYVLMAHSQYAYKTLGKLLGTRSELSLDELAQVYFKGFMQGIAKPANRKGHTNAMMHLMGYMKRLLSSDIKQELLEVIHQYRREEVNLATPLTLLKHYLKHYGNEYVNEQAYLQPYPQALGLANER